MVLDYIAASSLLIGYTMLANKKTLGWLFSIVGNGCYAYVGYRTGLFAMSGFSIVMLGIAAMGYFKWKIKRK